MAYQVTDDPDSTAGSGDSSPAHQALAAALGDGWPHLSTWAEADSRSTTTGVDPALATYNATATHLSVGRGEPARESWSRDYQQLHDVDGPISLAPPVSTHAAPPASVLSWSESESSDANASNLLTAEHATTLRRPGTAQPGAHRAEADLSGSPIFQFLAAAHEGWPPDAHEVGADATGAPSAVAEVPAAAWTAASEASDPVASVTQMANSPARARLDILMRLREVGVPVGINPRSETHNIYQAMEDVLAELPSAPALPSGAGDVIAIVGELTPALRTATAVAQQLRLPVSAIWLAGVEGHPARALLGEGQHRMITGAPHALELQAELRSAEMPAIVVLVTDAVEAAPEDDWAAQLLAALTPTVTWLMVDATGKAEDERAKLDRLGGPGAVDALAVHSAQISASPATTWDLGLPIALLDGRPANTFTWASLLFGALHTGARHLATA